MTVPRVMEPAKVGEVVLAGQLVDDEGLKSASIKNKIILGPGLKKRAEDVFVCKCGVLKRKGNLYWVDSHQKKYVPTRDEAVVGIVIKRAGDYFWIDIGSSEAALLHFLAFEGATKKFSANLEPGDLVFAKILIASPEMAPSLVCVNSQGKKEKLGALANDGFMFTCSLHLVRKLLNPECKLLDTLGKQYTFESAIGCNGRVWIRSSDIYRTIGICNITLQIENMSIEQINEFCKNAALV